MGLLASRLVMPADRAHRGAVPERLDHLARVIVTLPENTASWQVCLSKDTFRRRLEYVERKKLNPPAGLRASHEWMGDVLTIPEAGRQNPGSDKTPSSSALQDSTQPDELEGVMSLETALVRALQCLGAIW